MKWIGESKGNWSELNSKQSSYGSPVFLKCKLHEDVFQLHLVTVPEFALVQSLLNFSAILLGAETMEFLQIAQNAIAEISIFSCHSDPQYLADGDLEEFRI